jgi:tetratricopeptide (TPR) repeat protein
MIGSHCSSYTPRWVIMMAAMSNHTNIVVALSSVLLAFSFASASPSQDKNVATNANVVAHPTKQKPLAKDETSRKTPKHCNVALEDCLENLTNPSKSHSLIDLNKDIDAHPNLASAYVHRGAAYLTDGDSQNAIHDFRKAEALDPNYAPTYIGISRVYQAWKKYPEALAALEKASRIGSPDTATNALWEAAFLNREIRRLPTALEKYNLLIKTKTLDEGKKSYAYFQRGEVRQRMGDHAGAIEDLTYSIKLCPSLLNAHMARANSYEQLKKFDDAMGDYTAVIFYQSEHNPSDIFNDLPENVVIEALNRRANIYQRRGKLDLAEKDRATAKGMQNDIFGIVPFRQK